jgi:hypothetical protein
MRYCTNFEYLVILAWVNWTYVSLAKERRPLNAPFQIFYRNSRCLFNCNLSALVTQTAYHHRLSAKICWYQQLDLVSVFVGSDMYKPIILAGALVSQIPRSELKGYAVQSRI